MKNASTKGVGMAALFTMLLQLGSPALAQVYQWEDEEGVVNMTDNLKNIPEEYRDRAREILLPKEGKQPGNNAPSPRSDRSNRSNIRRRPIFKAGIGNGGGIEQASGGKKKTGQRGSSPAPRSGRSGKFSWKWRTIGNRFGKRSGC